MSDPKFLYRIFDHWMHESMADIVLDRFRILKETPKGAWINMNTDPMWGGSIEKKFVLLRDCYGRPTRKRWACETIQDAVKSFIARKEHQVGHLTNQLAQAQAALKEAKAPGFDPEHPLCHTHMHHPTFSLFD